MTEFSSKWQKFSPEGSGIEVPKVSKAPSETFDTSIAEDLSQKILLPAPVPSPSAPLVVALTTRCAPLAASPGTAKTVRAVASAPLWGRG
jgi:hypothetical protein